MKMYQDHDETTVDPSTECDQFRDRVAASPKLQGLRLALVMFLFVGDVGFGGEKRSAN
jgi:hypothetical protein